MKALHTLWKFSRPHAVFGSIISVITLYVIACNHVSLSAHLPLLFIAIITAICCNIFIVGINQIEDIAIDKINKPNLPLASGELSVTNAYRIIYTAMFIAIIGSAYVSLLSLGIIILSLLIGMAYSVPPLHLKRHHLPAALAITIVRGLLVNLGGFEVFNLIINRSLEIPDSMWILTLFIVSFSIAIAWFKDLYDTEGDARYHIKTLAVVYSKKTALVFGTLLVVIAYAVSIYYYLVDYALSQTFSSEASILLTGHIILSLLFLGNSLFSKLKEQSTIKKFYMRFWYFFFAEYALYLIAFI